jgi:drug/metabolite transporter (DMT)-like permease
MAAILIGGFLLFTKQKIPFKSIKKMLPFLLISGMAMGINWMLLFEAYKYTSVSVATLSYYFAPVIVTVVCPVLFNEKITGKQIVCFVMSTLGLVLITGIGDLSAGSDHIKGILFGLSAACLYASVVLLNKFIKGVAGLHRTFLQFVAAAAVLLPYVALTDGFTLGALDTSGWIYLLVVGLVHTGLAYCLYFSAIEAISGQQAAILSYVDPLVAILVSVLLLGEGMTPVQLLGGAMILGFTLWNELSPNPEKGGAAHE